MKTGGLDAGLTPMKAVDLSYKKGKAPDCGSFFLLAPVGGPIIFYV
jgi:hypothetical protein